MSRAQAARLPADYGIGFAPANIESRNAYSLVRASAAPAAFAAGFAAALTMSGVLVLAAAVVAYTLLAQPVRDA
ncbi:hypothetical protein WS98_13785 [Burkholderia territorii]|nr:hypothetical protein WS97_20625 [Burkholderia territorii]KVL35802.1 hypothetical protein WS98_13785 [Burkholderia territorii]KWH14950.1 hypothetical protein WT59_13595 [Burkholderia territorii]